MRGPCGQARSELSHALGSSLLPGAHDSRLPTSAQRLRQRVEDARGQTRTRKPGDGTGRAQRLLPTVSGARSECGCRWAGPKHTGRGAQVPEARRHGVNKRGAVSSAGARRADGRLDCFAGLLRRARNVPAPTAIGRWSDREMARNRRRESQQHIEVRPLTARVLLRERHSA